MNISIPEFSLIVMVGATSSGKSTLAGRVFGSSEIVASDQCRTMVADDPSDQTASREAFELVHFIARTRLKNRRLTVIDATNLQPEHRKELLNIARDNDCQTVAIAMNTPREVCVERNAAREDRQVHPGAVQRQCSMFRQNVRRLKKEGFNRVHVIDSQEEADTATITRARMRPDLREREGPVRHHRRRPRLPRRADGAAGKARIQPRTRSGARSGRGSRTRDPGQLPTAPGGTTRPIPGETSPTGGPASDPGAGNRHEHG